MTEHEIIDVCRSFFDEMYNGGFQFVLVNGYPDAMQVPQCLYAIGADEMAKACEKFLSVFTLPLPADEEERMNYLTKVERRRPFLWKRADVLNKHFSKMDHQLEELLGSYIDLHFPAEWLSCTHLKSENFAEYYCKVAENIHGLDGGIGLWRHNQAYTEMGKLNKELYTRPDKGLSIAEKLLGDKNPSIRYCIASYCLSAQIHVEPAKNVLTLIDADRTLDVLLRLNARLAVRHCKPYEDR